MRGGNRTIEQVKATPPAPEFRRDGTQPSTGALVVALTYRTSLELIRVLTSLALVFLVIVVLLAVVVRYVGIFPGSLHWATELSRFSIIWIVMLGSAIALDRGAHVGIELSKALPERWARLVRAAAYLLGVAFLSVLAWEGFKLSQATMRQISPALGLPMGYAYLALPVGAAIMVLQSVLFTIRPDLAAKDHDVKEAAPDPSF
jgi:TRAP-type C4-dicarboxylate transport system permease small subunit